MEEREIALGDYLMCLWRRKTLITAGTLVCMITATLVSLWMPDIYQSTATLLISPPQLQVNLESQIETATAQVRSMQTVKELINDRQVQEGVIKKLSLQSDSKMLTPKELAGQVQINDLRGTDLVELRVNDADPQQAALIANTWAELFIAHVEELELHDVESTGRFIQTQLQEAVTDLRTAEEELRDFSAQNRMTIRAEQIRVRSHKLVMQELRKADLEDRIKNQADSLTNTLYYSITGKMLDIQAELSIIAERFSEQLNAFVPQTKINSQAGLIRQSLNFKQQSLALLDREAFLLSKAITDMQLAYELEGKKQAIRLRELSSLEKNGTKREEAQALNSGSVMFEVATPRGSPKPLILSRLDPITAILTQERIDSEINQDAMQSQIGNYRELVTKLKKIRKVVVSEWATTLQEDGGQDVKRWTYAFEALPMRLDVVLTELSHISSLRKEDLAGLQQSRIEIQEYLQQLEAAQVLEEELKSRLDEKVTLDSFNKDSSEAIVILQKFPSLGIAPYIDELFTAQLGFLGLSNGLGQLENLRITLSAEFEEAGDDVGALTDIIEKSLEKLSALDAGYTIAEPLNRNGQSRANVRARADAGYSSFDTGLIGMDRDVKDLLTDGNGARSFLAALISFKALVTEMRVVADAIAKLDGQISRYQKELASGHFQELQLKRGVQTVQDTYAVLSKKWEEIKIYRELRSGTISLAKAAYPAEHRIQPNRRLNALLAGVFGLVVTVFLAFFLDYFQRNKEQPNDLALSSTTHP